MIKLSLTAVLRALGNPVKLCPGSQKQATCSASLLVQSIGMKGMLRAPSWLHTACHQLARTRKPRCNSPPHWKCPPWKPQRLGVSRQKFFQPGSDIVAKTSRASCPGNPSPAALSPPQQPLTNLRCAGRTGGMLGSA